MFFAPPEGLQDSAQGFNPGSPERARDQVGQMHPIATRRKRVFVRQRYDLPVG
jgi:hypothetical protein